MDFLLPKKRLEDEHLVDFRLYIPMGYVDSLPYFCIAIEMVADIVNNSMDGRHTAPPHTLEVSAEMPEPADHAPICQVMNSGSIPPPPCPDQQLHALAQVGVYMDNFISTCKGATQKQTQILRHLFQGINTVFRINVAMECLQKEPISTKKLLQGDAA